MADDLTYGLDYSVLSGPQGDDLDTTFSEIDGEQVLLEDVWKQVSTPAGSCFWAPTRTLDLRDYLRDSVSQAEMAALEKQIEALFEEDPRMVVSASVSWDQGARTLTVEIEITPAKGQTFRATIVADSNDVRIERE